MTVGSERSLVMTGDGWSLVLNDECYPHGLP
jgi:hypothetical protein